MSLLDVLIDKEYDKKIRSLPNGESKITYLANHESLLELFIKHHFNGYHLTNILIGADWEAKLNWAKDNFETVLKPMGFNGYHYSQIVLGAGWKDKLDWLVANYENRVAIKNIKPTHMAKIVSGGNWLEKAEWVANYQGMLNGACVARKCIKKNWREELRNAGYVA